ncbi:hypothetical protein HUT18_10605 [Streptomyces sp. NA04227]|uniref:hypothetical protein n=1 Tax=Streptomyces sp. NA04227 TaxID=2742136 RepID=UPI0015901DA4|nr:hypothetical protein [Streptomyces sp. NA04227]QKW06777.1 hypothetical protein HUT18_10605 [Streptomyces sp. NA04227]
MNRQPEPRDDQLRTSAGRGEVEAEDPTVPDSDEIRRIGARYAARHAVLLRRLGE